VMAWTRLVAWLDTREPVTWLALFRIAVGAIIGWTLLDMAQSGAMTLLWLPESAGGLGHIDGNQWLLDLVGTSPAAVFTLVGLALVSAALVTAGLGTRVAALVCGQALLALFSLRPITGGGHDRLITNALWLLVLAPSDRSLSLSARLRTGRWVDPTPMPVWVRWLGIYQLVVTYSITGWQKLGPEWWPWGNLEAVYRSLLQPPWVRAEHLWAGDLFVFTQAMTAATLAWECLFGVLLVWYFARSRGWQLQREVRIVPPRDPRGILAMRTYVRLTALRFGRWPVRAGLLGLGLVFHGMLLVTSDLGPFPFITVAYYLCCFDDADWRWLWARLGGARTA
jgi:hypothetical protein